MPHHYPYVTLREAYIAVALYREGERSLSCTVSLVRRANYWSTQEAYNFVSQFTREHRKWRAVREARGLL